LIAVDDRAVEIEGCLVDVALASEPDRKALLALHASLAILDDIGLVVDAEDGSHGAGAFLSKVVTEP
jgi:hypothetical protein